jgi:hypothetical protein
MILVINPKARLFACDYKSGVRGKIILQCSALLFISASGRMGKRMSGSRLGE